MDKLTTNQQSAIKKMTDLKLTAKLVEAGMDEQMVTEMDRNALMNAWAEILAAGKDKAAVASSMSTYYNSELEKQRLAFEMELKMKEFALKKRSMKTESVEKKKTERKESVKKRRKKKTENVEKKKTGRKENVKRRRKKKNESVEKRKRKKRECARKIKNGN